MLWADEIIKKDGEILEGKIEEIKHGEYYRIRTKDNKLFRVKWEDVENVNIEKDKDRFNIIKNKIDDNNETKVEKLSSFDVCLGLGIENRYKYKYEGVEYSFGLKHYNIDIRFDVGFNKIVGFDLGLSYHLLGSFNTISIPLNIKLKFPQELFNVYFAGGPNIYPIIAGEIIIGYQMHVGVEGSYYNSLVPVLEVGYQNISVYDETIDGFIIKGGIKIRL